MACYSGLQYLVYFNTDYIKCAFLGVFLSEFNITVDNSRKLIQVT